MLRDVLPGYQIARCRNVPIASWPVELHPACEVFFGQATRSPSVRCDFEVATCRDCTKGFLVQGREG